MTENLKWQTDLPGFGNSSPVVWGDRIFLTAATRTGSERYVLCFDRHTGKLLWQQTAAHNVPPEQIHAWNTHASATCVTDGERVYAFFGTPGVFCYDVSGKLVWKREIGKLGCSTGWGVGASSPILYGDLLIVNGDHGGEGGQTDEKRRTNYGPSYLWAFDKRTGAVVWKTERNQGMGWSTPVVLDVPGGGHELVLNSPHGVYAYDPRTGRELWRARGRAAQELFGEITPVWDEERIYAFTGRPGPVTAIRRGGRGDVTKTHIVWQTRRGERDVSSPLLVDGLLYQVDRNGVLSCYDAKTGEKVYVHRVGGRPCASLVYLRGTILLLSDDGTTHVFAPGRTFKSLHTNRLGVGDEFRASPAVVDGQILIRSDRRLYCVEAKE
jgi:outer membrane protein assembly factor BamB